MILIWLAPVGHHDVLRFNVVLLVAARTSPAPTAHTLHALTILHLLLRHATNTRRIEIRLLRLNAPQTTKLLIPLLLPLCNEIRIRIAVLQQPVVQSLRYRGARIVEVVDVAGALMCDLEDWPDGFLALFAFVRGGFGVFQLVGEFEERVFDVAEAFRWGLAASAC